MPEPPNAKQTPPAAENLSPLGGKSFSSQADTETTCKAFRSVITKRIVDQTSEDWSLALRCLSKWLDVAPKKDRWNQPEEPK